MLKGSLWRAALRTRAWFEGAVHYSLEKTRAVLPLILGYFSKFFFPSLLHFLLMCSKGTANGQMAIASKEYSTESKLTQNKTTPQAY